MGSSPAWALPPFSMAAATAAAARARSAAAYARNGTVAWPSGSSRAPRSKSHTATSRVACSRVVGTNVTAADFDDGTDDAVASMPGGGTDGTDGTGGTDGTDDAVASVPGGIVPSSGIGSGSTNVNASSHRGLMFLRTVALRAVRWPMLNLTKGSDRPSASEASRPVAWLRWTWRTPGTAPEPARRERVLGMGGGAAKARAVAAAAAAAGLARAAVAAARGRAWGRRVGLPRRVTIWGAVLGGG